MGETQSRPQNIPVTVGTVVNRPLTTTNPNLSMQNQLNNLRMQQQASATSTTVPTRTSTGRIINPNTFSSVRQIDTFELNNRNIWELTVVRPVYVKTDRIGMSLLLGERNFTGTNDFALRNNVIFYAIQKINPINPSIDVTDDIIYEVSAQSVEDDIERAILLFRPEEDRVQFIQANGTYYEEPWSIVRQSQDPFDVRALALFRTDYPEVTRVVSVAAGEKNTVPFFPQNRTNAVRPLPQDQDIFDQPTDIFIDPSQQQQQQQQQQQRQPIFGDPLQQRQPIFADGTGGVAVGTRTTIATPPGTAAVVTTTRPVPPLATATTVVTPGQPRGVFQPPRATGPVFVQQQPQLRSPVVTRAGVNLDPGSFRRVPTTTTTAQTVFTPVPQVTTRVRTGGVVQQPQVAVATAPVVAPVIPSQVAVASRPVVTSPVFTVPVDQNRVLIQEPPNVLVHRAAPACLQPRLINSNIMIQPGKKNTEDFFVENALQDEQLNSIEEQHHKALREQSMQLEVDQDAYEELKSNNLSQTQNNNNNNINNNSASTANSVANTNTFVEKQEKTFENSENVSSPVGSSKQQQQDEKEQQVIHFDTSSTDEYVEFEENN